MQRVLTQGKTVTWLLKGQLEFLWIIVTFAFTVIDWGEEAPAKAPADKNITASAAESVRVFRDFVILLSRLGGHALNLRRE